MNLTLEKVAQGLVGLSAGEATIILEQHGYLLRTVKIADNSLVITRDCRKDRVNVEVDKDHIITKMTGVG